MIFSITCALLILLVLGGLFGIFFCQNYLRKISCLSVSYSSFVVLIALMASKSQILNEILSVMVSILVVFALNLLIGVAIAKNIINAKRS
jgi:hypothetical protein